MSKLSRSAEVQTFCMIGNSELLIQCAEMIKNSGHKIFLIISSNPQIKLWAKELEVSCYDSPSLIQDAPPMHFDYLLSIGSSEDYEESIHPLLSPEKASLYYSNSNFPTYSKYAYTRIILNKEKTNTITWSITTPAIHSKTILQQSTFAVELDDTGFSLRQKCQKHALPLFKSLLEEINRGEIKLPKDLIPVPKFNALSSVEMPPRNTFIKFNSSAREIEKYYRALNFGNHKNPFGLLKFVLGNEIFLVRDLRILSSRSMTSPGTILAISINEIQISTTTQNIALSNIYAPDGTPYSIDMLCQIYKLAKGYQLKEPDPAFIEEFDNTASSYFKFESFWIKTLRNIVPGTPPLSVNSKETKQMKMERFSSTKIKRKSFNQLTDTLKIAASTPLLTLTLIYLFRINNYENFTVKFSNPELAQYREILKKSFVSEVPLGINFTPLMTYQEALSQVVDLLRSLQENKTYPSDMTLRYPELIPTTEATLVLLEIVPDLKNYKPVSTTAALTIAIEETGARFDIYSKKEAFPTCIISLIGNISHHIKTMLAPEILHTSIAIKDIPLLPPAERQMMLVDWNKTVVDFPNHDKPIHYFFEAQVAKTPKRIAVSFEGKDLSYAELNQKADQIACFLKQTGVSADTLVAISTKRSLEMVVGILGILKSGCAYLPLDPHYPSERLTYMIEDSRSPILLVDDDYTNLKLENFSNQVKIVQINEILANTLSSGVQLSDDIPISSSNLAYIIYTSGTTGKPKGVAITHGSLVNHMLWMLPKFGFSEKDVFLQKTPFSFDASVWEFFAPLLCGGRLVMYSNENPIEIEELINTIKTQKVTVLQLVPTMLNELLEEPEFRSCDSLQQVFSGGEALVSEKVHLFFSMMQNTKLHNLYGPTETTIESITYSYDKLLDLSNDAIMIGKPIDNVEAFVLDKFLNPVPIGVSGQLYIGGSCLARGYLNQEQLTSEKFIQNPVQESKALRIYNTGDRVRWLPSGNLEYFGRLDNQIKMHGCLVEFSEIEAALSQHDYIRHCAVVVRETTDAQGSLFRNKSLIAYYVKKMDLSHSDVDNYIKAWRTVNQTQYQHLKTDNYKLHIKGWNSSYTNKAIGKEKMLEWVNATVDRIAEYHPETVLEIGCDTGLILFNLIDRCQYYYATDFTQNVIDYINNIVQKNGYSDKVSTIVCAADDLYRKFERPYDTVILNSVVHLFPNLDYLENVITNAIYNLEHSGQIFIGDVRDFRLLKTFHYSVQHYKKGKVSKAEIDYFSRRDKELLISPEYFIHLKATNKHITHLEILPKKGTANTEMNNYRYDVVLHIRKNKLHDELHIDESDFVEWRDLAQQLIRSFGIEKIPTEEKPSFQSEKDYFCVKYPNKRIATDYSEFNKIYNQTEIPISHEEINELLGIDEIAQIFGTKQYQIKFFMSAVDPLYLYLVIFKNNILQPKKIFVDYHARKLSSKFDFSNNPLATSKLLSNHFSNELKEYLATKLPSYMIPDWYIPMDKLPLNVNGKLDRAALPEPEFSKSESYLAPRNKKESQLCQIWAEVLGLPEDMVGVQDDFFKLGGHSLSAIRILSLIKNAFNVKLPTRMLFDYPTIEKLSQHLQDSSQHEGARSEMNAGIDLASLSPMITLQDDAYKTPLFLIHPVGGTVFWYKILARYLDNVRPIYAIQDPGLEAHELLFKNIEEMATHYLRLIQKIQPTGPYLLAGASFGGTVAVEIAHQLLNSGQSVNFIGILDGYPTYSEKYWEKEFFEGLMLDQFKRMQSQFMSQGINDIKFLLKLQSHRMGMLRHYKCPLLNAKLTFFKAEELWHTRERLPNDCWQPFSSLPVDLHIVPGNHETMFWEPYVQTLAKEMNQCLRNLDNAEDLEKLSIKLMAEPVRLKLQKQKRKRPQQMLTRVT